MKFLVHTPIRGVPPLGSVMTPHMTRTPIGWCSRGQVYGQPGTQGIPVEDPAAVREDVNSLAAVGTFSSACAPNVIYPRLYYIIGAQERAPVSRISDDQMPVPAGRAGNIIVSDPYKARHGGQRQVYQPQVVQTWRGMRGTPNG